MKSPDISSGFSSLFLSQEAAGGRGHSQWHLELNHPASVSVQVAGAPETSWLEKQLERLCTLSSGWAEISGAPTYIPGGGKMPPSATLVEWGSSMEADGTVGCEQQAAFHPTHC